MCGDVGRCAEMWGDVRRCAEMCGDVGRWRTLEERLDEPLFDRQTPRMMAGHPRVQQPQPLLVERQVWVAVTKVEDAFRDFHRFVRGKEALIGLFGDFAGGLVAPATWHQGR